MRLEFQSDSVNDEQGGWIFILLIFTCSGRVKYCGMCNIPALAMQLAIDCIIHRCETQGGDQEWQWFVLILSKAGIGNANSPKLSLIFLQSHNHFLSRHLNFYNFFTLSTLYGVAPTFKAWLDILCSYTFSIKFTTHLIFIGWKYSTNLW